MTDWMGADWRTSWFPQYRPLPEKLRMCYILRTELSLVLSVSHHTMIHSILLCVHLPLDVAEKKRALALDISPSDAVPQTERSHSLMEVGQQCYSKSLFIVHHDTATRTKTNEHVVCISNILYKLLRTLK